MNEWDEVSVLEKPAPQEEDWDSFSAVVKPDDDWDSVSAIEKPAEKDFFSFSDTGSAVMDAFGTLKTGIPAAYHRFSEGLAPPSEYSPEAKAAFEAERLHNQQLQAETAKAQSEGRSTSVGETIREAAPSLSFSLGAMAPAVGAMGAGAAAGSAFPGYGTAIGAGVGLASFLGSGAAAYRMAGSSFIDDTFQELNAVSMRDKGRPMTEQEAAAAYDVVLPLAQDTAAWEAGPEAVGNVLSLGLGKIALNVGKPILANIAKTAMGRAGVRVAAGVGALGGELGTETVTQVGQALPQAKAEAFTEGRPMSEAVSPYDKPGGTMEAFKDVAPVTLATMGMLGTTAKGIDLGVKGVQSLVGSKGAPQASPEQRMAELESKVEEVKAAPASVPEPIKPVVEENIAVGNPQTAAALEATTANLVKQQQVQALEEEIESTKEAALSVQEPPAQAEPEAPIADPFQPQPATADVSPQVPPIAPVEEAQPTQEVQTGQAAISEARKVDLPETIKSEFRRLGAESVKANNVPEATAYVESMRALEGPVSQWANAFSGVRFVSGTNSAMAVEPGGTLLIDPQFIAKNYQTGAYTAKNLQATLQEEVTHLAVDKATRRILAKELGREATIDEAHERHAWDWEQLPENVRKESERLYRLAAIENARVRSGKSELTEEEIQAVISKIPTNDVVRGAEFKRQIMQGRIFGVMTEEAQNDAKFAAWLRNFFNELLEAIRDISKRITDPEALKKLDELETEVRAELAKLKEGGTKTTSQPPTTQLTDKEQYESIKAKKPLERSDEEIAFANKYTRLLREKEEVFTANPKWRDEFVSGNVPSTAGKLKSSLEKAQRFAGEKYASEIGGKIEQLVNDGWSVVMDARGNRQFTDGSSAYGTTALGKVGMDYADFAASKRANALKQTAQLETEARDETLSSPAPIKPERPSARPAFKLWQEMNAGDAQLQAEALDEAWTSFRVAGEANGQTEAEIEQAWTQEMADPESPVVFQGVVEAKRARKPVDFTPLDVSRENQDPNDVSQRVMEASPPISPESDARTELGEIIDQLQRKSERVSREGLEPTLATEQERTYKADGTQVSQYRPKITKVEMDLMGRKSLRMSQFLSKLPPKEFGRKVLDYLNNGTPLDGIPNDPILRVWLASSLLNNAEDIATELSIDPEQVKKPLSEALSRAGTALGLAANQIYNPLQKLSEEVRDVTDKEAKVQGLDPMDLAKTVNAEVEKVQGEQTKNLKESVQNMFEDALPFFDAARQKILSQIVKNVERISEIKRKLASFKAQSAAQPVGAATPTTVESEADLQAELDRLVAETSALLDEFHGTKKRKKKATAEAVVTEAKAVVEAVEEAKAQATFKDWVGGAEQEGIPNFDELVKQNVNAAGFNRRAFAESLTQKFESIDPDFIEEVTNKIGDALDGKEETEAEGEPKEKDYDGRAKKIIADSIKRDATPEEAKVADELSKLIQRRLKEEISDETFREQLEKLDIEPMTAFALNRKVESDINRRNTKEIPKKEIERLEDAFSGKIKDPAKKSKFRELVDGYKNFTVDTEELRQGLIDLGVDQKTTTKLVNLLARNRGWQARQNLDKIKLNVQKARKDAINRAVNSLKPAKPRDIPKRNKFVDALIKAAEADVLNSNTVRDAFAQAYELHGLTTERMERLAKILREIEAMDDGIPKQTLLGLAHDILNDMRPSVSIIEFLYRNLMGGVLGATSTIVSQFSRLSAVINPLQNTYQWMVHAKMKPMRNPIIFAKTWGEYVKEAWKAAPSVAAGWQGTLGGPTYGLAVSPSHVSSFTPQGGQDIARLKPSELYKMRIGRQDWVRNLLGFEPTTRLGRNIKNTLLFPSWMASRSFNLIRGAEAWMGSVDKNMMAKAIMAAKFNEDGMSPQQAWNKTMDSFSKETNKVKWDKALDQADKDIKSGLVSKFSRRERAEELMQRMLDDEFKLNLKNRHLELSAWLNFKAAPSTTAGTAFSEMMAKAPTLAKSVFLFSRFFSTVIERAIFNSPLGFIHLSKAEAAKGAQNPMQKRLEGAFGSLENYRQYRNGLATSSIVSTFVMTMATALAWAMWRYRDEDEEERLNSPPMFWITGSTPPTNAYSMSRQLSAGSWWQPNSIIINLPGMDKPILLNYVQGNPELAITTNAIGNVADRIMFPEMLTYSVDSRTGKRERSTFKTVVQPMVNAVVSPATRSTYVAAQQAVQQLLEGNAKGAIKIFTRPVGEAVAATVAGGPIVRDIRKLTKSETPRAAQDWKQAIASGIPFAEQMGARTGSEMLNSFGEGVSPFAYFPFMSASQESSPEVAKAANVLNSIGITKEAPQEFMAEGDLTEIAHDGKRFLLNPEERREVLGDIGKDFASSINSNATKIKDQPEYEDKKKLVQSLMQKSRERVLRRWRDHIRRGD